MKPLIDSLRALLGEARVLTDGVAMAPYLADWRGRYHGSAVAVARPATLQ